VARVIVSDEGQRVVVAEAARTGVARESSHRVATASAAGPQGPQGVPGQSGAGFTHDQPTAATVWTINHNLGFRPSVELYTVGGVEFDAGITHTSLNQTVVTSLVAIAGFARLT